MTASLKQTVFSYRISILSHPKKNVKEKQNGYSLKIKPFLPARQGRLRFQFYVRCSRIIIPLENNSSLSHPSLFFRDSYTCRNPSPSPSPKSRLIAYSNPILSNKSNITQKSHFPSFLSTVITQTKVKGSISRAELARVFMMFAIAMGRGGGGRGWGGLIML